MSSMTIKALLPSLPPHWSTWTPLQGYSHTLDIFRWPDGVSTGTGFNLYGSSLKPPTHPLNDYFPWRCSRLSPNFRQNSRCTDTINLLNMNCSTQNMRCCTGQRSNVHWIQGHTEPNHRYQQPLPNPHKQYCKLKMGNVKWCTLYMQPVMFIIVISHTTNKQLIPTVTRGDQSQTYMKCKV
jgi:hypothetical protein